ncbi:MAG TPA: cyclic-di-AMP receptor [Thermomicrobiales bacterium]
MKLIVAIVQDYDSDRLLEAVTSAGFGATRIASTGGFLRMGNTTVLMGVEDDDVPRCLDIVRKTCRSRVVRTPEAVASDMTVWNPAGLDEVTVGGAIIFVVNVERTVRIGEGVA